MGFLTTMKNKYVDEMDELENHNKTTIKYVKDQQDIGIYPQFYNKSLRV